MLSYIESHDRLPFTNNTLYVNIEPVSKRPYPNYQTRFITTHKNSVRCAKFSPDGKVIATGSADTSIKLLDVQKMVNYSQSKNEGGDDFQGARPVLRTLYDHTQAINDIDFHPTLPLLASASRDNTIKFYDYHSSMKKSFKYLQVKTIPRELDLLHGEISSGLNPWFIKTNLRKYVYEITLRLQIRCTCRGISYYRHLYARVIHIYFGHNQN